MSNRTEWCQWSKCHAESEIIWLGVGLCDKHWIKSCKLTTEEARKKLDVKDTPPEEDQNEPKV
jgi:hypothetical protein